MHDSPHCAKGDRDGKAKHDRDDADALVEKPPTPVSSTPIRPTSREWRRERRPPSAATRRLVSHHIDRDITGKAFTT
jgi:hypothetical protein